MEGKRTGVVPWLGLRSSKCYIKQVASGQDLPLSVLIINTRDESREQIDMIGETILYFSKYW